MKKKGFTLVELMVVVAIIAILAAVALPMYTRFKQKAAASGPVKVTGGITAPLQAWYDEYGTFTGIVRQADTKLNNTVSGVDVGANIPNLQDVTWTVATADATNFHVTWAWAGSRCPSTVCNGAYCLQCANDGTGCFYSVVMASVNIGLNKNTGAATVTGCAAP